MYKRQRLRLLDGAAGFVELLLGLGQHLAELGEFGLHRAQHLPCLLYTSDAADERSSVDLGGRRIIKKKKQAKLSSEPPPT